MRKSILAFGLSLTCILAALPSGLAAELVIAEDAAPYEQTTEPETSEIDVGNNTQTDTVRVQSYNSSAQSFGSQLEGDQVAVQAYEEFETAFSEGTYTCGSYKITLKYTSTVDQVVGATQNYMATDAEIDKMMEGFHRSVRNAYAAYVKDHPDIFYLGNEIEQTEVLTSMLYEGKYQWKVKTVTIEVESLFSSENRLKAAKSRYQTAYNTAVEYAKQGVSRYEQLKRAHDYLCDAATYSSDIYAHSSYGTLVSGKSVCEGYAAAFKAICEALSIPCVEVSGTGTTNSSSESHMWNLVQMSNGKWYAVDVTWDDRGDAKYNTFFLVGRKSTAKANFGLGAFSESHVASGYFYADTATKEFSYPTQNGSKYFVAAAVSMQETAAVDVGYSVALTAAVTPEKASVADVTWSSSDETIAAVDKTGTVTGVSAGEATITAASEDGPSASCRVTVSSVEVQSLTLPAQTALSCNRTEKLTAEIVPERATNKTLHWSSSDENIASVDQDGTVTGIREGTAEITAVAENGVTASTVVTVSYVAPTKVTLSGNSVDVYLDGTLELEAKITPKNVSNPAITWSSSDAAVAAVDSNGVVSGMTEGTAEIRATAEGDIFASCKVTVHPIPVDSVTLDETELLLYTGDTKTLQAEVSPAKATHPEVTWKSANPEIASVASDGTVTANREGKTTISATADGVTASCTVQIVPHLEQPQLVDAVNAVKGVRVTWTPVDSATGYMICRKRSGSWAGTQLASVSGQSTSVYLDKTTKAGRAYYYTVYAMYGDSKASSFDLTGLNVTYIPTPGLGTISNARAGILVRWEKVDIADGYYLYRREASENSWTMVKKTTVGEGLSYMDTTAKNRYTYCYTVRAYVGEERSAYHTAGVTLRRVSAPDLRSVKNSTSRAMKVRWSRVSYVTGYQVQYARSADFAKTTTITIADKEKLYRKITGLTKNKTYYVRVRTYKTQKGTKTYSAWSAKQSVKIAK